MPYKLSKVGRRGGSQGGSRIIGVKTMNPYRNSHLSRAYGGARTPRWVGGGRDPVGTYTIRAGRRMHWRHTATGALGISETIPDGLAYVDAGYEHIGRRRMPTIAPRYTMGHPDKWCNRKSFLRVLYGNGAISDAQTYPPIPKMSA